MSNELEIKTALKLVEKSIRNISSVEGEMLGMPFQIANCIHVKYKNGNNYRITLMSKSMDIAVLDNFQPDTPIEPNPNMSDINNK